MKYSLSFDTWVETNEYKRVYPPRWYWHLSSWSYKCLGFCGLPWWTPIVYRKDTFKNKVQMMGQPTDNPRWRLIISYSTAKGTVTAIHDIVELTEVADIVEKGPNWYCVTGIEIKHIRGDDETLTVEQALNQ